MQKGKGIVMLIFAFKRLARALLTIFIVVIFAFVTLRLTSDPTLVVLGPDAPADSIAAFRWRGGSTNRSGNNSSIT